MKANFDNFEARVAANGVTTAVFDIEGLEGSVLIQVKQSVLLKHVKENSLNFGYFSNAPDELVEVNPENYLDDHYKEIVKDFINKHIN